VAESREAAPLDYYEAVHCRECGAVKPIIVRTQSEKVADLLFSVTELQRQTGCIILLCPHMTKAPKYEPPTLT
jgi:hypothetical protein